MPIAAVEPFAVLGGILAVDVDHQASHPCVAALSVMLPASLDDVL